MEYKRHKIMKALSSRRKGFLLTVLLLAGGIASAQVVIKGSVYGGGEGNNDDKTKGLVTGNTLVEMNGGIVERSIYGGGQLGSVGTFTSYSDVNYGSEEEPEIVQVPVECTNGTGLAKVLIKGGQVGKTEKALMPNTFLPEDDDYGYVFCGGRGEADSISYHQAIAMGVVDSTYLEISGTPIITASVYGGSENGLVLGNTHVKVLSGQIGLGYNRNATGDDRWCIYTDAQWAAAINAVKSTAGGDEQTAQINAIAGQFYMCDAWPYGDNNGHYNVYDIFYGQPIDPDDPDSPLYQPANSSTAGTDGHTFFGKLYGGGSGFYPIRPGIWRRTAGQVNGSTLVEIEGGHILSSVYGGNEITDVLQTTTVKMTGGTVGIPRTKASIESNPITCHLYGAGYGDQRTMFNKWNNAHESYVDITGDAVVFGSVFGGGEDGHVWTDTYLTVRDSLDNDEQHTLISSPHIGTWGTTAYEGNVFGAGRGFSGFSLVAGSVVGNTNVTIEGGHILGSVYGGGRLGSVGVDLLGENEPHYGDTIVDGEGGINHGHVTVNINGGHIGNSFEDYTEGNHTVGGNVFGGSKGGIKGPEDQPYPLWLDLAKVKKTQVNINDAHILSNVFGGGEIGSVWDTTGVNITHANSIVDGNVYGGGLGDMEKVEEKAGLVYGSTTVNMTNGYVNRSIYGGGDLASVGTFTEYTNVNYGTEASPQIVQVPKECTRGTGVARVFVSGGKVGDRALMPTTLNPLDDEFGWIFCGSRGEADSISFPKAIAMGVVDSTYLEIKSVEGVTPPVIAASVYGGCENGLVVGNTHVKIMGGQIGLGHNPNATGDAQWCTYLDAASEQKWTDAITAIRTGDAAGINAAAANFYCCNAWDYDEDNILVYDIYADSDDHWNNINDPTNLDYQTSSTIGTDGNTFFGKVFGGGSGYYPIAPGVWRRTAGNVNGNTLVEIEGGHILTSVYGGNEITDVGRKSAVLVKGGTIGIPYVFDAITSNPNKNHLYGGGQGDPRAYFNTWTNVGETDVIIEGGIVFGSAFGGGEDGHVIDSTKITIRESENSIVSPTIGTWGYSGMEGNVFGGGRGFSSRTYTAGCVLGTTEVNIEGGLVLSSVYGGGRLASVGFGLLPYTDPNYGEMLEDEEVSGVTIKHGYTKVNIKGGTIGHFFADELRGGNVYGGSKGLASSEEFYHNAAQVKYTEVNVSDTISKQTFIKGSVFGSGEDGHTLKDTYVNIYSGQIGGLEYTTNHTFENLCSNRNHGNVYGGGRGLDTYKDTQNHEHFSPTAGKVSGNTNVTISGGRIYRNVYGGGNLASVGNADEQPQSNGQYLTGLAKVTITGGTIGVDGLHNNREDSDAYNPNGLVFGSGKGKAGSEFAQLAFVKNTKVTIKDDADIKGSVFGSGEDGHTRHDTYVLVQGGAIGTQGDTGYEGNVYGGGCGLDKDEDDNFSETAGITYGNTKVEVTGGLVKGSVFGGGRLSSVGIENETPVNGQYHTGLAEVIIGGGSDIAFVGTTSHSDDEVIYGGNVYGGGKGFAGANYRDLTFVKNTDVTILDNADIHGSVFGGGEDGHVRQTSTVNVQGGIIGDAGCNNKYHGNVYGAGRGIDKDENDEYSWTAGRVNWNSTINISGGQIYRNVYGGGNLASVGMVKRDGAGNPIIQDGSQIPLDTLNHAQGESGFMSNHLTGWARINITGGVIGIDDDENGIHGNVFGSSHGQAGETYQHLAYVHNTDVTVETEAGTTAPLVKGSVFGGGEDGHVTMNTKVTVNGGQIGSNAITSDEDFHGNVYGGGRGIDMVDGQLSPTAGLVRGHTRVYVNGGDIYNSVYGGGNKAVVGEEKVVNINGGMVARDVFGGCHAVPSDRIHAGRKTVNMRGGTVFGNVYGCSNNSVDGDTNPTEGHEKDWTAFVNISGGTIGGATPEEGKGNVYGAGEQGLVYGSVSVCIGKEAIENAFNNTYNVNYNDFGGDEPNGVFASGNDHNPNVAKLLIGGNVYGGSDYFGTTEEVDWSYYDVKRGYSNIYIDGTGYNMEADTLGKTFMYIAGGLFGSGTHCESGEAGRHILLKDYGIRATGESGEMTSATRTLTTIQRVNNLVIDEANVGLSGIQDISNTTNTINYGIMRVKDTLIVANGGGIELGSIGQYAHIDSIHSVHSLKLASGTIYDHDLNRLQDHSWYWMGIQGNTPETARTYYVNGTSLVDASPLPYAGENVILYNDTSKMRVRYWEGNQEYYGELRGFFRMKADAYYPYDITTSFAYARPKLASYPGTVDDNTSDGGFLSYTLPYNFYTDRGATYTKTKQHPYLHPYLGYRGDHQSSEYRMWVAVPQRDTCWYVDGVRGWGRDDKSKTEGSGLYPDKPKKTIFGPVTHDEETGATVNYGGIYTEQFDEQSLFRYLNFHYYHDVIYVVGALSAEDEIQIANQTLHDSISNGVHYPKYPLRLFRYPGGHEMSNGLVDYGGGADAQESWGNPNGTYADHGGPGANYGAMLNVQADKSIEMQGVVMDGLANYDSDDEVHHQINTAEDLPETSYFDMTLVTLPLVVTHSGSTLALNDSTVLKRCYNGTNAKDWYTDAFYDVEEVGIQGGAIYVDENATVNVSDEVYVIGNTQCLQLGDASTIKAIDCNVFLPTFDKSLTITDALDEDTRIGVTSPMGNDDPTYIDNTFSPVAIADMSGATSEENHDIASDAWVNCNFLDDQGWFFVNENYTNHQRTTYYDGTVTTTQTPNPTNANLNDSTLFFGWTWANIVRSNPGTDSYEELIDGTTIKVKDAKGLAWLISQTSGMNGVDASSTDFTAKTIKQTGDVDLIQYVWVPVGSQAEGYNKSFAGTFDGQGHLIKNLSIEYIGEGDSIYERQDYGLFGYAFKGTVNRTFVVSGKVKPVIINNGDVSFVGADEFNVAGLVGHLNIGSVYNSEAAVEINCPNRSGNGIVAGGLVAKVQSSVVHSSMAMPQINTYSSNNGPVGGLIGSSTASSPSAEISNSFVNAIFNFDGTPKAGGLIGSNDHTDVRNCYVNWHDCTPSSYENFKGVVNQAGTGSDIDYCYVKQGVAVENFGSSCGSNCNNYTSTVNADQLGYMYFDNIIEGDTTLTARLNINAMEMNSTANDSIYSHWARPGLAEINGDLPVLLLNEFDVFVTQGNESKRLCHQGNFRCLSTYAGGAALQYGGPVRDDNEVDSALTREQEGSIKDCLFIYGDVNSVGNNLDITQGKVSYHEDASILSPGQLTEFANNYVGISFDNSCGNAMSTPGVNYGLIGMGGYPLPRDWHMFSTPLSDAPLGFNYTVNNVNHNAPGLYAGGDYNNANYYNNPWMSMATEYTWLTEAGSSECAPGAGNRYWLKTFDEEDQVTDGYFPTQRGNLFTSNLNELFFVDPDSDECPVEGQYRYPYGMDFYCWSEPEYHWINFKRNGPNHWHSDVPHIHLDYLTEVSTNHPTAELNVNEENLISGKGYMAAITKETFLQSHGYLNGDVNNVGQSIGLLNTSGSRMPGWNLVGNPYHGYLDFEEVAKGTNLEVLSDQYYGNPDEQRVFYVVYNADKYDGQDAGTAFRYYPVRGSINGDYADRYLHPHQGFYVKAKDNGPLLFKESMLVTRQTIADNGEESHLRDERPAYPLVNLYLSSDQGCADVTVIEFERPDWGGAIKMKELRVGDGVFYAQHDNTHYAALFAQQGIDRVPLWFEAKEDDIFNIKWNTANGDFHSMYLIDNLTGVQYDMIRNNSYTFEGHKGDYPSRFLIVFNVTDVEEHTENHNFVFFDGSQWLVTGDGELEFIDLNGQVLWEKKVNGGQSRVTVPEVASGMYLFRLTNGKETKVQKVIVNR